MLPSAHIMPGKQEAVSRTVLVSPDLATSLLLFFDCPTIPDPSKQKGWKIQQRLNIESADNGPGLSDKWKRLSDPVGGHVSSVWSFNIGHFSYTLTSILMT